MPVTSSPIDRIAAAILNRRERGLRCRVCGTRTGDEAEPFCSPEHALEWENDSAW